MSLDFHTYTSNNGARLIFAKRMAVANPAGGSAGASVTIAVSITDKYGQAALPANLSYVVDVTPSQDCTWYVTGKTASGFNVVLTPRLAANTLAAGSFDVGVTG